MSLLMSATPRVLVLDVGGSALEQEEATVLRESLASELGRRTGWEVLSSGDVRKVLDMEVEKQAFGCDTDACLAELGAALGASRVLHGSVARLGDRLVLTLSLVDPQEARSIGRASGQGEDAADLHDQVPDLVRELISSDHAGGASARSGAPVVTIVGATIGVVGLVATAVTGGSWLYLYDTTQDPRGDPVAKQTFLDLQDEILIATAVSAGVLVLGAGVTLLGIAIE